MLVGVMVGDPIGFTVLKHVYHFETEILFKGLLLLKKKFRMRSSDPRGKKNIFLLVTKLFWDDFGFEIFWSEL